MTINVNVKDGNRYGSLEVDGVTHSFPTQSITSTNLNHKRHFNNPNFDFGTKICEIRVLSPDRLIRDSSHRHRQSKKILGIIDENPGYLFLFAPASIKSLTDKSKKQFLEFTKKTNESLIDFQKECGFSFIKVFFKSKDSINDYKYYRTLVPNSRFVACIDENMHFSAFRKLYKKCLDDGDQIVSFFGRLPSKRNRNNQLNFLFLSNRPEDKILRLASCICKSRNGRVLPLFYYAFGIDAYSFSTTQGPPSRIKFDELRVVDGFFYKELTRDLELTCPITGKNLFESCETFAGINKRYLPALTYNIVTLNEQFNRYPLKYSKTYIQSRFSDII